MRFSRALLSTVAGAGLLATSVTGCTGGDESGTTDIFIGADLELTGAAAPLGQAYQRALQLRVEQVNASGALGRRNLVLRITDNRSDPGTARRNVGAYADEADVAAIITGACSQCALDSARTVNDRRVPTVSLAAADDVASPVADRRYMFKVAPNAADSAAELVGELRRSGARKVAVVHTDDVYGRDGADAMQAELAKAQLTPTGATAVKATDTDVAPAVRTALDGKPDALVVWAFADQAGRVATGARAAGFTGAVFFDAAAAGDLFLPPEAAKATERTTMVFPQTLVIDDLLATNPAKAARKQWFRDYTSRWGSYSGPASFGADAVQLIADAVAKVGGDRERIRDVLETTQVDGLSGPIRFTPDNHSGLSPQALSLIVARGGRWRPAG